jgi:hypothetical protein
VREWATSYQNPSYNLVDGDIPHIINNKTIFMAEPKNATAKAPKGAKQASSKVIPLKAWTKTNSTELISHGRVKDMFPKGTKMRFIPKNFRDKTKLVTLRFELPTGELYFVSCSKPLSQIVRAGEITIPQVLALNVVQLEDQLNKESGEMEPSFRISLPQDQGQSNDYDLDQIEEDDSFEVSNEFLPEGLLDF